MVISAWFGSTKVASVTSTPKTAPASRAIQPMRRVSVGMSGTNFRFAPLIAPVLKVGK